MRIWTVLVLCALGLLIYSNSLMNAFHLDDFPFIVENDAIKSLHGLSHIWDILPTRYTAFFSFALNYHWGGLNVCGYHWVSLLIHIGTSLLVWQLMCLTLNSPMMKKESTSLHAPWIAFFTAAVFLTHPLQTQAVNYIFQRAVLLAAFFYIASLVFYIKAGLAQQTEFSLKTGWFYYAGAIGSAILAIFSKEFAVTLPFMICFYQWCFFRGHKGFSWARTMPFFLVILLLPLTWLLTHPHMLTAVRKTVEDYSQGMTVTHYALTQLKVVVIYVKLLIMPIHQRVEYDLPFSSSFFEAHVLWGAAIVLMMVGIGVGLLSRFRLAAFGLFWFLIALVPESSFWPNRDLIFEHRLYLPMLGFSIFLCSGIFYLSRPRHISVAIRILLVCVLGYAILTYQRNAIWKNEFTLWDDAVHQSPNSARAYLERGAAYQNQGDLSHAMADYNMVIGLGPLDPVTLSNRGLIFAKGGQDDLALANFNLAIKIDASYVGSYVNRALLYRHEGKFDQACQDIHTIERLNTKLHFSC